jgi:hypothetical protein
MPTKRSTAERKASGGDLLSKERDSGFTSSATRSQMHCKVSLTMPIASPIINTKVWSARAPGDVRKKYASVIWKRERDVMIVFPDMSAMMFTGTPQKGTKKKKEEEEGEEVGEVGWLLFVFMRFHEAHKTQKWSRRFRVNGSLVARGLTIPPDVRGQGLREQSRFGGGNRGLHQNKARQSTDP